jgi:YD repeat-containing protein
MNSKNRDMRHNAVIRVYDAAGNMTEAHTRASSKSGDLLLNFLPDV